MFNKNAVSTLVTLSLLSLSVLAMAGDRPYKDNMKRHHRQDEVNKRLNNQTDRAEKQAGDGKITQQQAGKIENQDKAIYNQEQGMIKRNEAEGKGDMLTKRQQARLNREENRVNREDRRDVRQDAANANNGTGSGQAPAAPAPAPGN